MPDSLPTIRLTTGLAIGPVTLLFIYACFEHGGVTPREWGFCLLAVTLFSMALWLPGRTTQFAPSLHPALLCALLAAVLSVGIQLAPLPFGWLKAMDPARAGLLAGMNGLDRLSERAGTTMAPLSVAPAVTFAHLERLLSYLLMFFMARELSWRTPARKWLLTIPVIVAGTLEAALGLTQYFTGAGRASGTYVNPNHFAALMHMALPMAAMPAVRYMGRRRGENRHRLLRVALSCLFMACSAAILLGALYSISRMGLITVLASGGILAGLGLMGRPAGTSPGPARMLAGGTALAIAAFVIFAAPGRLADRFFTGEGQNSVTGDLRTQFWMEAGELIVAYPVFGSGLGTYGSAIQKFRDSAPLALVDFAHNDYLQIFAEIGVVGMIPWLVCAVWLFVAPWRAALAGPGSKHRLLAVACAASLSAVALDSTVDFGFYVPANMLIAAWIAGIGSGLGFGRL